MVKRTSRAKEFESFDIDSFLNDPDTRQFVGKNFDIFATLWRKDWSRKNSYKSIATSFHWNAVAVLVSPAIWFAYRKMYGASLSIIFILCTMIAIENFFHFEIPPSVYSGWQIAIGLLTKGQYFFHVHSSLKKIKSLPLEDRKKEILRRGGTSTSAAILAAAFTAILIFLIVLISMD